MSLPKIGKTRSGATSFLEFPAEFTECICTNLNEMRNVQDAGLTDLEKREETSRICFLPSGRYKNSHRFHSSERKQQNEGVKESAFELKVENVL